MPEQYVSNLNTRISLYHKLAKAEHIEEVADAARELQGGFGSLPEPVGNVLYIVKIKVVAIRAKVGSVSTEGRQVIIKSQTNDSPLKIRGVRGVMSKYLHSAARIGPTEIKLDTRLLGNRWKEVLDEILRSNCAYNPQHKLT
jgi:transcription-repair coupling factor (superfamily II helicase)